jgi:hypothetical protein
MMNDKRRSGQAHTVRAGLCARCAHVQIVAGRASEFYLCRLSFSDPRFPRYPSIPVLQCSGFQPSAPDREQS